MAGNPLPLWLNAEFANPFCKNLTIQAGRGFEHGADVFEVFLRATFLEEKELIHDHRLGRREPRVAEINCEAAAVFEFPMGERIATGQVAVGFHARSEVDDVEMTPRIVSCFGDQNFFGWQVEFLCRKNLGQFRDPSSLSGFDYLKSQDSRFWNFENLVLGSRGFYFGAVGLVWVNEAGNFLLYAAWSLAPRMWRRLRL